MENYLDINRRAWDVRAAQHLESDFYDVKSWLGGKSSLTEIELPLLHELDGKSLLHLQCHFGLDTLSLARLGAQVTGLDLSPRAITAAQQLSEEAKLKATFVEGDVYLAPQLIPDKFDLVFSSYGTIGWLPDIERWAQVIAHFIRPGGKLVFAEFHPALWMLDDTFESIQYSYFNGDQIEELAGTYTDVAEERPVQMISWNHGLAEVLTALMRQGLKVEHFQEYAYSPYNIFGDKGVELAPDRYAIKGLEGKLPLVYSLVMRAAG